MFWALIQVLEQFLRGVYEGFGAGCFEGGASAEAPCAEDVFQAGTIGGLDIYLTITYV